MAKVLVIDDSSFQRRWIVRALHSLGHETIEAENGYDGLEMLRSDPPDCVTVDLNMPEMDGITFLGNLQSDESPIPVIVVTANIQSEVKKQCQELGAAAFLNKPFKPDELVQAVQHCLDGQDEDQK